MIDMSNENYSALDNELVIKYKIKIMSKYHLDSNHAENLAIEAIHGLESHGGSVSDEVSMNRVIDVVVKSWIENGD